MQTHDNSWRAIFQILFRAYKAGVDRYQEASPLSGAAYLGAIRQIADQATAPSLADASTNKWVAVMSAAEHATHLGVCRSRVDCEGDVELGDRGDWIGISWYLVNVLMLGVAEALDGTADEVTCTAPHRAILLDLLPKGSPFLGRDDG